MMRRRLATLLLLWLGFVTVGAADGLRAEFRARLESGMLVEVQRDEIDVLIVLFRPGDSNARHTRPTLEDLFDWAILKVLEAELDPGIQRSVSESCVALVSEGEELDAMLEAVATLRETTEFSTSGLVAFQDALVRGLPSPPSPDCLLAGQLASFAIPKHHSGCSLTDPLGGAEIDRVEYQAILSVTIDAGVAWVQMASAAPLDETLDKLEEAFDDWEYTPPVAGRFPTASTRHVWHPGVGKSVVAILVPLFLPAHHEWELLFQSLPRVTEDGVELDVRLDPIDSTVVLTAAAEAPPDAPAAEILGKRELLFETVEELLADPRPDGETEHDPDPARGGDTKASIRRLPIQPPTIFSGRLNGIRSSEIDELKKWWTPHGSAPESAGETGVTSTASPAQRALEGAQTFFILSDDGEYERPVLGEDFGEEITDIAVGPEWRGQYEAIAQVFLALADEEPSRALALLDAPSLLGSSSPLVLFARASSLQALGRRRAALGACRATLLANPDFAPALRLESQLHLELGHPSAAQEAAHRVLELAPHDAGALLLAARAATQLGEIDEAERLLRLRGEDSQPLLDLGLFLLDVRKQPAAAFAALSRARAIQFIRSSEPTGTVDAALIRAASALDDPARAVELLASALDDPKGPRSYRALCWIRLGLVMSLAREEDIASAFFEQASRLLEKLGRNPWTETARQLTAAALFEEAGEAYERALAHDPEDLRLLGQLARCRSDAGRPEEALQLLDEALAHAPQDASLWYARGEVQLFGLEDPEAAQESLSRALELDPGHHDALSTLGLLHEREERYQEALAAYERCYALEPYDDRTLTRLGRLLHERLDRPVDAERVFREATEHRPRNSLSWAGLGRLLFDQARFEEALPALERAVDVSPTDTEVLAPLLAMLDAAGGQEALERATEVMIDAAERSARPKELNGVAWTLAAELPSPSRKVLERALGFAEAACTLTRRQDANILDTLAEVHFRLGQRSEALRVIDEALALPDAETDYLKEQRARFSGDDEVAPPAD